ncbi:putative Late embryogenesis abundant protein, SMP subgroup [Helianthus annuus]|uniref:Late embryogenesis abundant protein, SMP subgroup n=1 Tax=Helianthus annuus TaxID=4232 RepID=A0A9K3EMB5_HELAN|nr:putative Late embryogenesis abundant protein, SMP subgroup [Helianthus annuus]KAJ0503753.1 putative Late embryogenesis abundant protein, SMP subgroup [Helianthus annuus]KAJ0864742.1 putative Late embryogenesis abundant protein, SMP subgroup [Helianthus annuus]
MANKAITPEDAATVQSAENMALGHIHKGGPAAVMQSAASVNRNRGLHQVTGDQHFTVSEPKLPGNTSIPISLKSGGEDLVTVGEALEAVALSATEKPVEQSDAAAIQAAEVRATRRMQVIPGGVVAKAQGAASQNARTRRDEEKTKLGDVLTDASSVLPKDKMVTREDAKGVIRAEIRNQPELATYPGGVAASMAAAARLNQNK